MSIFKYCVLIQMIFVVVCHGKPQKSEGDYDTSILKPCELAIWRYNHSNHILLIGFKSW